jgi:hypothetical protein
MAERRGVFINAADSMSVCDMLAIVVRFLAVAYYEKAGNMTFR